MTSIVESKTFSSAVASNDATTNPALRKSYEHSPKIIVISGHPCAGKTYVANQLVDRFGYAYLSLDSINVAVRTRLGIGAESLEDPATRPAYVAELGAALRKLRFCNIVTEGSRYTHPHVSDALDEAILQNFGEYTIVQKFFLETDESVRLERFLRRKLRFTSELLSSIDVTSCSSTEGAARELQTQAAREFEFCRGEIPANALRIAESQSILDWADQSKNAVHPKLDLRYAKLVEDIANSTAYNPFYQTIEVEGQRILHGFTHSYNGFENLRSLGISWNGKSVCEIGCNHGYYLFRVEEEGSLPTGYDICPGAIYVANRVAMERKSRCTFEVRDCCTQPLDQHFDIILAFSVMHRVGDFQAALMTILDSCNEAVFEVNLPEIAPILQEASTRGFILRKQVRSRSGGAFGARDILHLQK